MARRRRVDDPIPHLSELLWPTLQALKSLGDSATVDEIENTATAGYPDSVLRQLHKNGPYTEINYRLTWARSFLKIAGAAESSRRGIWTITDKGRALRETDMPELVQEARRLFRQRREGRSKDSTELELPELNTSTPESAEHPSVFQTTDSDEWRNVLLGIVQQMSPANFEKLCQRVLRESGFIRVEVTGRSGDGGIDGIGVLRVSLLSFHVFFQCKRYKGSVGAGAVRDFRGAMVGRTDKGLLITTGSFTPDAMREATRDGAPVLDLIDGERLCHTLKDLSLGVTTQQVEQVSIDREWFNNL